MSKFVVIGVIIGSIILGILFWKLLPNFFGFLKGGNKPPTQNTQVTLNWWGLWEDDSSIKVAIDNYQKLHPNVKINYTHQSSTNYRTRVQTQISNGQGPDILMIHNSWLPMFVKTSSLSTMPETVMSFADYSKTFYPVAVKGLTANSKVYAIPQEVDGLALYYNEDLLNNQGLQPPATWPDFTDEAVKLTVTDSQGNIQTAGAALGTVANIDHWSDILGLLFLQQPGALLQSPNNQAGADVLQFYTSFVKDPQRKPTWSLAMPNSTQAFAEGRLAFYFGPSWEAQAIRQSNPQLKFKIVPVPQLPGTTKPVSWATFWAWAVASNSPNVEESWKFLDYLTSGDAEKAVYQESSKTRLFGQPYSRVDLKSELASDPLVGAYVNQGPTYDFWFLASNTFDAGIDDEMIKYYEDAVNSTIGGASPAEALSTAAQGVSQVLDKYTGPPPTPVPSAQ